MDSLNVKIEFVIGIGYKLYDFNLLVMIMRIDIRNIMNCNCDTMHRIKIGIDVCDTFNGITSAAYILITISIVISSVDVLTIILGGNGSNLDKLNKFEGRYGSHTTIIIISIMYKISVAVFIIIVRFLLFVSYLIVQEIDESLLRVPVTLSIKFELIFNVIILLVSNLAKQLSNDAVYCDRQVIHSVCGVF